MSTPIHFKISSAEGTSEEGDASRIVVWDALNVLTIGNQHAPLIAMLENGKIEIFSGETLQKTLSYKEGFLRCKQNNCHITVLS